MEVAEWITANTGSLIAGAIVILLLIVLLRSTIRAKRNGDCGCGCGCSHCSGSCPHCVSPAVRKEERNEIE